MDGSWLVCVCVYLLTYLLIPLEINQAFSSYITVDSTLLTILIGYTGLRCQSPTNVLFPRLCVSRLG